MAIRKILEFPDPRLRTRAASVEVVDERIQTLIDDMFETMYDANGIGLAASQIDVHEQVIVIDLSSDRSTPRVFVNPKVEVIDETVTGLLAVCLQHEMDHLQGKLFVDYLSPLKRQRIRQRLEKEQRRRA